jgi:putative phosphoesterase
VVVGVLSDTHGLLRPQVLSLLSGVDHILHAGDVGDDNILDQLRGIAPVTAIRGNVDRSGLCAALPATEVIDLAGCLTYMLHSIHDLDIHPAAAGISLVVSGHSHQPSIETRNGVLYLNPGSAGPRRFSLPVTIARVTVSAGTPTAQMLPISL